jgi:hypothetical protein
MATHTPGLWRNERDPNREEFYITSASREGLVPIAAVEFGFKGTLEDEQHANARLIAAAPELLAACRRLLDKCEAFIEQHPDPGVDAWATVHCARAAIAKATGEAA